MNGLRYFLLVLLLAPLRTLAHPMPSSLVQLELAGSGVAAEVQLPLPELHYALPALDLQQEPTALLASAGPALRAYLLAHVQPVAADGRPWTVTVQQLGIRQTEQELTGPFAALVARLWLVPPAGASARTFSLHYDAVMHQVVTHSALVSIRQDWDNGVLAGQPVEVGVIRVSPRDNTVYPLEVSAAEGSWWRGFRTLVALGISHIGEGTDHLLFLLALLLPAPLLVAAGRRWGAFGGVRYSVGRLVLLVTAFTLGHSATLLLGAPGWVQLPGQLVEALIAVSILVAAAHAVRPLFPGRERWVAAGFGLVHGLAFAGTLAGLHLDAGRLALSILGFNLGIELMQLLVVALTVPWLLLLACTPAYRYVRAGGAAVAGGAALAWLAERLSGQPNALAGTVTQVAGYAPWLLATLAGAALLCYWRLRHPLA